MEIKRTVHKDALERERESEMCIEKGEKYIRCRKGKYFVTELIELFMLEWRVLQSTH
jgi:hypothetical protein